jgi:DNA repair protein RecN (Recombination protein N)
VLTQLTIRNFAIIDRLEIDWQPGLNVITGETGAGKSILIDAVGALLGDRLGPDVVRSGAARALVEGVFTISNTQGESEPRPELQAVLDEYGLEPEDGALIVSREVAGSGGGRGGARINGRAVPLSVLQELGELLVDTHGQSEHMALLRPREQLDYLDRYAGLEGDRAEVAGLIRDLRATREALRILIAEDRETARLQDMLQHEVSEIEAADLHDGEDAELLARRARLEHQERLRQAVQDAVEALAGTDDATADRLGAVDLLGRAVTATSESGKIDPILGAEAESLNGALIQAEESARALRDYLEAMEADPQALDRVAERLFLIGDLKRKYGDSIAEILAYAAHAQERLTDIEHRAEHASGLQAAEREIQERLSKAASTLLGCRQAAATKLASAVEIELADLRLPGARFVVSVVAADDADGIPLHRADFLLAANADDEPRPIARAASGGELARIALALKTVLSRAETRPTLIFDEIDVGVGGRTAPAVGEKLWAVAGAGHQVLCVTHLAQVAAFGDSHYVVSKSAAQTGSETSVTVLGDDERIEELAAMLAGTATKAARQSARELLERAARVKSGKASS